MTEAAAPTPNPSPPPPPAAAPPVSQPPPFSDPRRRSPFLAAVLSLMPGLGQVYVGYYQRGFIYAAVVGGLISLLAEDRLGALIPLAGIFLAFFWLFNVIDAGRRAMLCNEALAGRMDVELPRDFAAPAFGGSLVGGFILVVIGMVLLSHTLLDVSLQWLEDWWPAGLIAFGGYLVYRARQEAASRHLDATESDV